ncbi:UNVERIFIED_CONTAM: hypothetical protein B566_EDAN018496 [Ephemera danica]|nr:hypothetical protein B566_EDAN018496 [Ephemera danica]
MCIGDINARSQCYNKHLTTCVHHVSQMNCTCATPPQVDSPVITGKGNPGVTMPDTGAVKKLIEDLLSVQIDTLSEQNKTLQDLQNKVNHQELLITEINSNLKKLLTLTTSPQNNIGISQPTPTTFQVQQIATKTPPTTRTCTPEDTQPRENRKVLLPTPPPPPPLLSLPLQSTMLQTNIAAPSIEGREKIHTNEKYIRTNNPPSENDPNLRQKHTTTREINLGAIPKEQQQPVKPSVKQPRLKLTEIEGDLFLCSQTTSLAHCVARDLKMSAGIATDFKLLFGEAEKLKKENAGVGNTSFIKTNMRYIFYMITKDKSTYDCKPTFDSLKSCLISLREQCTKFDIKNLAMPRIGTGIDMLPWPEVKKCIYDTFHDMQISIEIYHLTPQKARIAHEQRKLQLGYSSDRQQKTPTVNKSYNIEDDEFPPLSPIPTNLQLRYRSPTPPAQSSWTPKNDSDSRISENNSSSWTPKSKTSIPMFQDDVYITPKSHIRNSDVTPAATTQIIPKLVSQDSHIIINCDNEKKGTSSKRKICPKH